MSILSEQFAIARIKNTLDIKLDNPVMLAAFSYLLQAMDPPVADSLDLRTRAAKDAERVSNFIKPALTLYQRHASDYFRYAGGDFDKDAVLLAVLCRDYLDMSLHNPRILSKASCKILSQQDKNGVSLIERAWSHLADCSFSMGQGDSHEVKFLKQNHHILKLQKDEHDLKTMRYDDLNWFIKTDLKIAREAVIRETTIGRHLGMVIQYMAAKAVKIRDTKPKPDNTFTHTYFGMPALPAPAPKRVTKSGKIIPSGVHLVHSI
jgi:hypothetical protein